MMTDVLKLKVARVREILRDCPMGSLVDTYWGKAILKQAKSGKRFPLKVVDKAGEWTTCACGKLSPNLKRRSNGAPKDHVLGNLGTSFFLSINGSQTEYAANLLVRIEQRAAHMMQNQGSD